MKAKPCCAGEVLVDVLCPGLNVVFCGTAAGDESARRSAYYADPRNQFWSILAKIGLVPRVLLPEEFSLLLKFGIGLTDIAKSTHGSDANLRSHDFDVPGFVKRVTTASPRVIAFNGKKAAAQVLGRRTKRIDYGLQDQKIGSSQVYVLTSTSGGARRYWNERHWFDLARRIAQFG